MEFTGGKVLTFFLGREEYGIPLRKVKEINGMMEITSVPRMPVFVKGVINLRGKIIPIIDLRLKFGMEEREYTPRTCLIILEITQDGTTRFVGVAVDTVSEVINIQAADIEPPPQYGTLLDSDFLIGMGKVKDKVVMLLDVDKVLSTSEVNLLRQAVQAN